MKKLVVFLFVFTLSVAAHSSQRCETYLRTMDRLEKELAYEEEIYDIMILSHVRSSFQDKQLKKVIRLKNLIKKIQSHVQ